MASRCAAGRASAEFLERDQLLLVAVQQPAQRGLSAGEVALERSRRRVAGCVARIVSSRRSILVWISVGSSSSPSTRLQASSSTSARRTVGSRRRALRGGGGRRCPSSGSTRAASRSCARRAAVVRVAAVATDEDPLQQRWALGVARRDDPVALQSLLNQFELLGGHERRYRDRLPLLGRRMLARGPGGALSPQARLTRGADGRAGRVRLAVGSLPHTRDCGASPDGGVVPACSAGSGRHALLREPARDLRDRLPSLR